MDTSTLITGLAQFLPPAYLAEATRRIMVGEEAMRRVAEMREQAADRQRRKRAADASALSRDSRDGKEVSPYPSKKIYNFQKKEGERLPLDWKPDGEGVAFAEAAGWSKADIAAGILRFRDYWSSVVGEKARSGDWPARWRVHVSNFPPRYPPRFVSRSEPRSAPTPRPMSGSLVSAMTAMKRLRGDV